jgi:Na+-transporting methylmalonyl-CoA/oxaloacetate decarboxylase gamma subunit
MASVFLFWWLLILGVGAVGVFVLDKFVLKPRREQNRASGPFASLLGQVKPAAEPVEEPMPVAAAIPAAESTVQRRTVFQGPMAEPRRYFIGKGPIEDDKA